MPDSRNSGKWYNWIADNGLPLPLVRHKGRGDLVATAVVALLICLMVVMVFGGTVIVIGGTVLSIPKLDSISGAAASLIPFIGALFVYLRKRGQDKESEQANPADSVDVAHG